MQEKNTFVKNETGIPSLSVSAMAERLGGLYASAINSGMPLRDLPSAFLWGAPGIGKSDGVRQAAAVIEKQTGKTVHVTDIRLLLFSPIDLRGVPTADRTHEFTEWLRPKLFDLDCSDDTVNILFLDELSAAPQSMQAAAYQITLDRTIGEHRLPDNTIVMAAGNRMTDRSVAFRMPNALANRMLHFHIDVDFESWRSWAVSRQIHPLVLGYLSFDHTKLYCEPEGKDVTAYPTPRTWAFLSGILTAMGVNGKDSLPEGLHPLIAGCIGTGASIEFEGWCNVYRKLPPAEKIFSGARVAYPKKPDVLYALISSIVYYASVHELRDQELENACRYAQNFPKDYASALFRDLLDIPGLQKRLVLCPSFQEWMNRRKG